METLMKTKFQSLNFTSKIKTQYFQIKTLLNRIIDLSQYQMNRRGKKRWIESGIEYTLAISMNDLWQVAIINHNLKQQILRWRHRIKFQSGPWSQEMSPFYGHITRIIFEKWNFIIFLCFILITNNVKAQIFTLLFLFFQVSQTSNKYENVCKCLNRENESFIFNGMCNKIVGTKRKFYLSLSDLQIHCW